MPPIKTLVRALTNEVEGGYRLTLETDDGHVFRVFVTEDQLADLADDIDELLDLDDAEAEEGEETAEGDRPTIGPP